MSIKEILLTILGLAFLGWVITLILEASMHPFLKRVVVGLAIFLIVLLLIHRFGSLFG